MPQPQAPCTATRNEFRWRNSIKESESSTTCYDQNYRAKAPKISHMSKLSVRDLALKDKRVFIRVDFNVPLAAGGQEITSDKRIKASLQTIQYCLEQSAGVILASHLGRPKGKPNPEMSLKPVAVRLAELLGRPVKMAPDCVGPEVEAMKPAPGEVLLLENLRYHAEEEQNDPEFS